MMKTTYATNLAAATLLVVPALALGTDAGSGLRSALADTIRSIEALSGLSEDVTQGQTGALSRVRMMTEAPILDGESRDEYLVTLRREVGQLRMREELGLPAGIATAPNQTSDNSAVSSAKAPVSPVPTVPNAAAGSSPATPIPVQTTASIQAPPSVQGSVTTGLDDRLRLSLSGQARAAENNTPRISVALEADGFSADPLLEAQANYRSQDYGRALALLAATAPNSETSWWRGRCLEKLGRLPEALSIYESIVNTELGEQASDDERAAHTRVLPRAQRDIEFLRWAIDFKRPLTSSTSETQSASGRKTTGK